MCFAREKIDPPLSLPGPFYEFSIPCTQTQQLTGRVSPTRRFRGVSNDSVEVPQGLKPHKEKKGLIAALKALRRPGT